MCISCNNVERLVAENKIDLELVQKMIDDNILELYAGNCLPEEIPMYIDKGNHYTINTYYRCKACNKNYYIGFCLYGRPIIKEVESNELFKRISQLEWGYVGTYFSDKKK